jgi:non-specific serine/threonine protein kinase
MVDWSWDLLSEPEQILLRRLAVFAGGWTREAAGEVASGEWRVASEERDDSELTTYNSLLETLVERSMVVSDDRHGSRRYHLLDTIRAYALEKLRASGEEPLLRERHLAWIVELAEQVEPLLWTSEQKTWATRLDRDLPNVRAALAWSLESGRTDTGLRIAGGVWHFWEQRGHLAEARRWLSALLAAPAGQPTVARARALGFAAYFAYLQGDREAAVPLVDEALALARAVDDPLAIVTALVYQAILAKAAGDIDRTETYLQEALARSREAGLERGIRVAFMILGETARMRGDDRAAPLLEQSLALAESAGDGYSQGYTLMSLGHLRLRQGDLAAAQRWLGRALAVWHDLEDVHILPHALEGLAWVDAARGKAECAACLLGAASALREAIGGTVHPHWQADHERATETALAALGERTFAAAWRRGRAMTVEQAVAYALGEQPSS